MLNKNIARFSAHVIGNVLKDLTRRRYTGPHDKTKYNFIPLKSKSCVACVLRAYSACMFSRQLVRNRSVYTINRLRAILFSPYFVKRASKTLFKSSYCLEYETKAHSRGEIRE